MRRALFTSPATRLFNTGAAKLLDVPVVGRLLGRGMAVVRYTGRRSGNVFELPVGYRRSGEHLNIAVMMPEAKTWWRNFLDDGAPITVRLDGAERRGHAVATRDSRGRVSVEVRLDPT